MRDLLLSALDDGLSRAPAQRARAHSQSVEQEAVEILRRATLACPLSAMERITSARAIMAMTPQPQTTDSSDLLREERTL